MLQDLWPYEIENLESIKERIKNELLKVKMGFIKIKL